MEKKLVTPPEILCKKMPVEFSYYFHYCRNLKFEDRPDYSTLKALFTDLLSSRINLKEEVIFDWFDEENAYRERKNKELEFSGRKIEEEGNDDKKKYLNMGNVDNIVKEESKEYESNINIKNEKSGITETPGRQSQNNNNLKDSISSASDELDSKKKPSKRDNLISEGGEGDGVGGIKEEKKSESTNDVALNKDK